jgi:hypothetical protein
VEALARGSAECSIEEVGIILTGCVVKMVENKSVWGVVGIRSDCSTWTVLN